MSKIKRLAVTKVVAKAAVTPDEPVASPILDDFGRLRRLNKRLAIGYAIQALAILLLIEVAVPITAGSFAGPELIFNLPLAQIVAFSLAISATFHWLQSSYIRRDYEANLRRGESPYRWLENAFSASLLPIAIGLVVGIRDLSALLMLFTLGFVAHLLGWQFERQLAAKHEQDARRSFVLLAMCSLTGWLAVGIYVLAGALQNPGLPLSVIIAYVMTVTFVALSGWIMLQHKRGQGKWQDFLYTEKSFIMLSFITKSLLAWQLYAITL